MGCQHVMKEKSVGSNALHRSFMLAFFFSASVPIFVLSADSGFSQACETFVHWLTDHVDRLPDHISGG